MERSQFRLNFESATNSSFISFVLSLHSYAKVAFIAHSFLFHPQCSKKNLQGLRQRSSSLWLPSLLRRESQRPSSPRWQTNHDMKDPSTWLSSLHRFLYLVFTRIGWGNVGPSAPARWLARVRGPNLVWQASHLASVRHMDLNAAAYCSYEYVRIQSDTGRRR